MIMQSGGRHIGYKKNENIDKNSYEYSWLSDLVELLESGENPEHYYEYTKLQLYSDQVFCFTPNGAVIRLPKKATPVDFAYAVHTDLGDTCTGCKINGKHSPLQTELRNGDHVEILSSTKKSPSYHWLSYGKLVKQEVRYEDTGMINYQSITKVEYINLVFGFTSHKAGTLGEVCTLIGKHKCNIFNVELVDKKEDYLSFIFDVEIKI